MKQRSGIHQTVENINRTLPVHAMWDGFWIEKFKRSNLVVSCSQDRLYYRSFDIVFKKVIFHNLPAEWRDTNVLGDNVIRLSDGEEFAEYHSDFDIEDRNIFAIDLHYDENGKQTKHTFFVVGAKVYLFRCEPPNNRPEFDYTDPLGEVGYGCKQNRV